MLEPEYGCEENPKSDDSSVITERCFVESYKGDSRKWLLRDGFSKSRNRQLESTTKATYPYPLEEDAKHLGERKARILKQLYNEAAEEVINERNKPAPVEEYCTEYDGNFNNNILVEKDDKEEEKKKELYDKYPLYTSASASFWQYHIKNLHGITESKDRKQPFKRCSGFSKPISEVLDVSQL